eukprot:CAMPEP_0113958778 /NCGR_PEP_ID=MMETSP0011_2-20120614/3692_1 /TAXON_ID=101924 /ORGANISM="Rhodosorus marinus" /LENGTH=57 /DNA_ID=CAMNT_0000969845 /DNA_START=844 /DNA_END=1014 /DNA_ORIENTATION=- /assembly_acc=CAM_ASM_000156
MDGSASILAPTTPICSARKSTPRSGHGDADEDASISRSAPVHPARLIRNRLSEIPQP